MEREQDTTLRVSSRRPHTAYVYEAKEKLKGKGSVELHGLGEAINNTVRSAEMLCSLGYAKLDKFETLTVSEADREGKPVRRAKVIIILSRTPNFFVLYEEFEKNRPSRNRQQ